MNRTYSIGTWPAVLLVATEAMGGVHLAVQPTMPVVGPDGTLQFSLYLSNPEHESVWGYSLHAQPADLGVWFVAGRRNDSGFFTDPTIADSLVIGKRLESVPDLGFSGVVFTDTRADELPLQTLTLMISPPGPISWWKYLTFTCVVADIDFNETPLEPVVLGFPEPVTLVFMAIGTTLLVRRRVSLPN